MNLSASDFPTVPLLVGHHQVTDAYLLALAIRKSGRLAEFFSLFSQAIGAGDNAGVAWGKDASGSQEKVPYLRSVV